MRRITLLAWLATQSWVAAQVTHDKGPVFDDRGANPSSGANIYSTPTTSFPKPAASSSTSTYGATAPAGNGTAMGSGNYAPAGNSGFVPIPGLPGITSPGPTGNILGQGALPASGPATPISVPDTGAAPNFANVPLISNLDQIDNTTHLKPGDLIIYQVEEDEDEAKQLLVTEDGTVTVPYLKDPIKAEGMTLHDLVAELKPKLEDKTAKLYNKATIRVAIYRGNRSRGYITVNGSVQGGQIRINVPSDRVLTLADVLHDAGLGPDADLKKITITRQSSDPKNPEPVIDSIDVKALWDKAQEPTKIVAPGDFIKVPSLTQTTGSIEVTGEIRAKPGIIIPLPTNKPLSVSDAILSAGWSDFSIHNVYVYRYEKDRDGKFQKRTYRVDVDAVLKGDRAKDMELQDGDLIWVDHSFLATQ